MFFAGIDVSLLLLGQAFWGDGMSMNYSYSPSFTATLKESPIMNNEIEKQFGRIQ